MYSEFTEYSSDAFGSSMSTKQTNAILTFIHLTLNLHSIYTNLLSRLICGAQYTQLCQLFSLTCLFRWLDNNQPGGATRMIKSKNRDLYKPWQSKTSAGTMEIMVSLKGHIGLANS